jgi:AIPR protein
MTHGPSHVLKTIIEKARDKDKPGVPLDDYFEFFAAQQTLKERRFNLDPPEIESGIYGGSDDGGVDGFYVFVNRKFIREDTDPQSYKDQQVNIDLLIIQAKNTDSMGELVPQKLKDFTEQCLPHGSTLGAQQQQLFGQTLLAAVKKFHDIYDQTILHSPKVTITYAQVSLGDQIHPKVQTRSDQLKAKAKELFTTAEVEYLFVTGTKLLKLFDQHPETTVPLRATDFLHSTMHDRAGYVFFATLPDFYDFIAPADVLQEHIFEANVRAHAVDVKVNQLIAASLANPEKNDFWWLNNGVTILATKIVFHDNKLHITNPLVVNGLQTSYEIAEHFAGGGSRDDTRKLLVRIVVVDSSSETSDQIITATNSQTKIEPINLHATEQIQRQIEKALSPHDLYYDRRKNYYRNKGVPLHKIVTIGAMAQAVAAIVLQQPDNARARPTTVAEKNYVALFSDKSPLEMYPKCALVMKRVEAYLYSLALSRAERLNLLFYIAMFAVSGALRSIKPQRQSIADMDVNLLTDKLLKESYEVVSGEYRALGGDDKVAKGPDLVKALKVKLVVEFGGQRKRKSKTSSRSV